MVMPKNISSSFNHVFILLDDVRLEQGFDLTTFVSIMKRNNLTAASPRIVGATVTKGEEFRYIMDAKPENGTIGFRSSFVEIFAYVMTIPAYASLWQLLYPSINPYGWGYDLWYDCVAKKNNRDHSAGVIATYTALHDQDLSKTERADNTDWPSKWEAVIQQEKYYGHLFKIPLKRCREHFQAVTARKEGVLLGYLY